MPTHPITPPDLQMTLHVKWSKRPESFGLIASALERAGFKVSLGEPITQTPAFVIRELVVTFKDLNRGQAALKAIRAIEGAEVLNFSMSR